MPPTYYFRNRDVRSPPPHTYPSQISCPGNFCASLQADACNVVPANIPQVGFRDKGIASRARECLNIYLKNNKNNNSI